MMLVCTPPHHPRHPQRKAPQIREMRKLNQSTNRLLQKLETTHRVPLIQDQTLMCLPNLLTGRTNIQVVVTAVVESITILHQKAEEDTTFQVNRTAVAVTTTREEVHQVVTHQMKVPTAIRTIVTRSRAENKWLKSKTQSECVLIRCRRQSFCRG